MKILHDRVTVIEEFADKMPLRSIIALGRFLQMMMLKPGNLPDIKVQAFYRRITRN